VVLLLDTLILFLLTVNDSNFIGSLDTNSLAIFIKLLAICLLFIINLP